MYLYVYTHMSRNVSPQWAPFCTLEIHHVPLIFNRNKQNVRVCACVCICIYTYVTSHRSGLRSVHLKFIICPWFLTESACMCKFIYVYIHICKFIYVYIHICKVLPQWAPFCTLEIHHQPPLWVARMTTAWRPQCSNSSPSTRKGRHAA
jgi:hypothetical protein